MRDELGLRNGIVQGDAHDLVRLKSDHRPDPAVVDGIDRRDPKARGEHPVKRSGATAPLDVAEDGDPRLEPCTLLDLCGQHVGRRHRGERGRTGRPRRK